jgi:dihydrolipoamide dehydrogenase
MAKGQKYDLAVIGGGIGGYSAAIRASQLGMKVVLAERKKLGGVCLHTGCIPSRALLKMASLWRLLNRAEEFGLSAKGLSFDFSGMLAKKDEIVEKLHSGLKLLMKKNGIEVINARGALLSSERMAVNGEEIEAEHILIATGSRSRGLPFALFDGNRILSSRQLIELGRVPQSMIVIGGGPIGLEMATVFSTFGCKVTVIEMLDRIAYYIDQEITDALTRSLKAQGIEIYTSSKVSMVSPAEKKIRVSFESPEGLMDISSEILLIATGRAGNSEDLGLEKVGVKTEKGFISVDDRFHTGVGKIYAVGDVIGGKLLAHVASAQGIRAAESMAGIEYHDFDPNKIPGFIDSEPPVASIGLSEEACRSSGKEIKVGHFPFAASGRALVEGSSKGQVKLITEAETGEILGAHILGPEAAELISEVSLAMYLESTCEELARAIHPHPTLAEAIEEAARDIKGQAIHK